MDLATLSLSSVTGIIATTMVILEILKRIFQKNKGFGSVPVFVYAIGVSIILATIASKVIKTPTGDPILPGLYWEVLWKAVIGAASASGFYSWLNNPESVGNAQPIWSEPNAKTSNPK